MFAQDTISGLQEGEQLSSGQLVVDPVVTRFGDWSHVCFDDDAGNTRCQLQHVVLNSDGGRGGIFEIFNVEPETGFTAGAAIVLPLGVSLADGVELHIDGVPSRLFEFAVCINDGCLSRIGLSSLAVQRLSEGAETSITVRVGLEGDNSLEMDISSEGIVEAFALLSQNPERLGESAEIRVAGGEIIQRPDIVEFDDWIRTCVVQPNGSQQCQIRQVILNDNAEPLATVNLFKVVDDDRFVGGAEVIVPHGVSLGDGVELQTDDSLPRRYQFTTCIQLGCYARIGVTSTEIERMKSGIQMTIVFYANVGGLSDQQVKISASLIGFTSAFNSL